MKATEVNYMRVTKAQYLVVFEAARQLSDKVAEGTSKPEEIAESTCENDFFVLSCDGRSGYVVKQDGELVGVFSLERGRGQKLIKDAIFAGATKLDCFDGYLVDFYSKAGFMEVAREANWTEGEPDIVFMERIF